MLATQSPRMPLATETGERCFTSPMNSWAQMVLYFQIIYIGMNSKVVCKVPVRPSWSIGLVKQRSPVSVANGIRGDCVASTMHSRLYFPQLRSDTHSELG